MYKKRSGTSGIRGQLYETKLLSLINFRALHDADVEEFYLATNVADIGSLDDICLKAKVKGFDQPITVFIQAKFKENNKLNFDSKNNLVEYFQSYLKIRRTFEPSNEDVLFQGRFDETVCLFVLYTTANSNSKNDAVKSSLYNKVSDLIGTGGTIKQFNNDKDVEFLCKTAIEDDIIKLAEKIAKFIFKKSNINMLVNDELLQRYHIILAEKVIDVSEIQSNGQRTASFRQDFYDNNEEFILLLKDKLYQLVIKKRQMKDTEIENLLTAFFKKPSDIEILSKLIGCVIYYKDRHLVFVNKTTRDSLKRKLSQVHVLQLTVNAAIELAAIEILSSLKFNVSAAFGNRDITVRGNGNIKTEKRLNYLVSELSKLINESNPNNNIITIDETLDNGFLELNGGIASAVGNILVFDETAKLMKFTDNCESLGHVAKILFEKLKDKINNFNKYRFEVKVKKFPKLSFNSGEHEKNLARDFLDKLLLYTNQADERRVKTILKKQIKFQCKSTHRDSNFKVRTDAIFLKYHDEIQKWWMTPKQSPYLKKDNKMYENAKSNIVKEPLMSVINAMFMNRIKSIDYKFNEDAMKSLNLQDHLSKIIIVTESILLTALKVKQYVTIKDHVVLDLEYILNLPTVDRNALCDELSNTNEETISILVFNKIPISKSCHKTLENIAKAVQNKKYIVITNSTSQLINKHFRTADSVVYDDKNNLSNMSEESQKSILKNSKVIFQGKEVSLDMVLDEELMALVQGDILNKIISKEIIEVGKTIGDSNYDKIKHLYVDRRMSNYGIDDIIETFYDIKKDVVFITALPGMGKSTLLTQLSLKTKEVDPKVWIVRINLLKYSKQFGKWMKNKTIIGALETLNFMCHVILKEKHGEEDEVSIVLEELNGVVYLKECTANQWVVFEIKLFLHYYNTKKIIFVFDGFDEICPHYVKEVINCIRIIRSNPRKHQIWIASRPYGEMKSILEREFGKSYEVEPFSYKDRQKYLEKFWKSNLKLTELDSTQLDNVNDFIEFMSKLLERSINGYCDSHLEEIYTNAVVYLINEIKFTHIPLLKVNRNNYEYNYIMDTCLHNMNNNCDADKNDGIPLHLYLVADYFQNEIKDVNKNTEKWDVDFNSYTIYERFIEMKLKTIRFQEKNKIDIDNPDNLNILEKERADFMMMHKKLAAYYYIYYNNYNSLFDQNELNEIKETIQLIQNGREKTGFICDNADDMPMFIHVTFIEFFAAEYVCDLLKGKNGRKKQALTIDILFNEKVFPYTLRFLEFIDCKLKRDEELLNIFLKNEKLIFDSFMQPIELITLTLPSLKDENNIEELKYNSMNSICYWSLTTGKLPKIKYIILTALRRNITPDNLDDFLQILTDTYYLTHSRDAEFIAFVLNTVRNIDVFKLRDVISEHYFHIWLNPNYSVMSTEEMVRDIKFGLSVVDEQSKIADDDGLSDEISDDDFNN